MHWNAEGTKAVSGSYEAIVFERLSYWHYIIWAHKTIVVKEMGFSSLDRARERAANVMERLTKDCQIITDSLRKEQAIDNEDEG